MYVHLFELAQRFEKIANIKAYKMELAIRFPEEKRQLLLHLKKIQEGMLDFQYRYGLDSDGDNLYGQLEEVKKHLERAERLFAKTEFTAQESEDLFNDE